MSLDLWMRAAASNVLKKGSGRRMSNNLFYGDNLDVLGEQIASESVDLVYVAS